MCVSENFPLTNFNSSKRIRVFQEIGCVFPLNTNPFVTMSSPLNPGFALHLRVEWDTDGEEVDLPEICVFSAEQVDEMIAEIDELVGEEEEERKERTNDVIVKKLEAWSDWLVESWEVADEEEVRLAHDKWEDAVMDAMSWEEETERAKRWKEDGEEAEQAYLREMAEKYEIAC